MTAHKEIEVMAPVGSYESLIAASQGGADSVYFGVGNLNMRSRSSQNFNLRDLREISSFCKNNNLRSYITLNTVIYDEELSAMKEIIDSAGEHEITAIIASDPSVIQYAHDRGVEVHMSTQTNITNIESVKYYSQYANVMVTARELNLDQVKDITTKIDKENITGPSGNKVRIEVFAHGALCMAISGKCYLSLDTMNSSANRGECYQICRRPYRVFDKDGEIELMIDNEYIMSPKDLMTIHFLDKILDSGVTVLKIEGRGRSADYVKTVTSCYREAVDAWYRGSYTKRNIEGWIERLKTVYNRGFWDGYYLGRKLGEWSKQYGSQAIVRKEYIGRITNYYTRIKVAELKIETGSLQVGDKIRIIGPTTGVYEGTVEEIRLDLEPVENVKKGQVCSIPVDTFLRRSDKLYRLIPRKPEEEKH